MPNKIITKKTENEVNSLGQSTLRSRKINILIENTNIDANANNNGNFNGVKNGIASWIRKNEKTNDNK